MRRLVLAAAAAVNLAACAARPAPPRAARADDFGDTLRLLAPPRRIVSLNPTTTELLFALGAGSRLVGRTHWDAYPDSALSVPDLGPGIRPNLEAVLAAHPDLVVLYASNDNRDAARALRAAGVQTLALKIDRIADFHRAVTALGDAVRDTARARVVADSVQRTLDRVRAATSTVPHPTVFWHVWDAPLMTIGGGSYMTELVEIAGGRNVYASLPAPSASVSLEDVIARDPEFVLAGPVNAARIRGDERWTAVRAVREGRLLVVDTALVGRPSVQLGHAAVVLAALLHPHAVR